MTGRVLTPDERLAWLQLARSENVGPITFHQLIAHYGSASAALAALPDLAWRGGRRGGIKIASRKSASTELSRAKSDGLEIHALPEPGYPPALRTIDDPPPLIYIVGNPHLLDRHAVAVVGARNASASARQAISDIAAGLAAQGFLIVSGMARGIDSVAHHAALDGGTAAVLAGGIDVVYPKENQDLYDAIRQRGVLISEMPPGTKPLARHFPKRNRIISGMALGTVIIEAAVRSGSLITARLAAEQGREVFAIPGSPTDPRNRGTNNLIRDGATFTETVHDILPVLQPLLNKPFKEPDDPTPLFSAAAVPDVSGNARDAIIELLGPAPAAIDDIIRLSGQPASAVITVLLELELAGRLTREPGHVTLSGRPIGDQAANQKE